MAQLSERLNRLAPSATLAMSQKSSEMKAQGIDVINMSVGEPDFNTPEPIKEAAKKAIDKNYSRYSPVPGYPDLRKAIVSKLKNENDLDYTTDEVLVSNGAKQSVCNTIMALVNDGEEVIIPAPYWVSYPQMVKLAGSRHHAQNTHAHSMLTQQSYGQRILKRRARSTGQRHQKTRRHVCAGRRNIRTH